MLKDTRHKVDVNVDIKKYYDELKSLQDLLGTYEKWLIATETPAEETADISKQLEQSKVMQYVKTIFLCMGKHQVLEFLCKFMSEELSSCLRQVSDLYAPQRVKHIVAALSVCPSISYLVRQITTGGI